jgi:hypothetical protein
VSLVTHRQAETRIRHPHDLATHREDGLVADQCAGRHASRVHDNIRGEVEDLVQGSQATDDVVSSRRQDLLVKVRQVQRHLH